MASKIGYRDIKNFIGGFVIHSHVRLHKKQHQEKKKKKN